MNEVDFLQAKIDMLVSVIERQLDMVWVDSELLQSALNNAMQEYKPA